MQNLRLMDRLSELDLAEVHIRQSFSLRVRKYVQKHLSGLLNTKQGSVLIDNDYGVPDFSIGPGNGQAPNGELIAQVVLALINSYEPRLIKPKVKLTLSNSDNLSMAFVISGLVETNNEHQNLTFSGTLLTNGSFLFDPIE
jgi:type VI secretion system protein